MTEPITNQPIDLPRLRDQIRALFSDSELRDLCLDLDIDYEDLRGTAKGDKVRELVLLMERLGRLPDLLSRVVTLRPHIGLNFQRLADELMQIDPQRGSNLNSLIEQFQRYNKEILEWKELHRQINVLLTVFDPFRKQVERFEARPERFDLYALQANWQTVNLFINQLLRWAMTIDYIGPRFQDQGGQLSGVDWAIRLGTLNTTLRNQLGKPPDQPSADPADVWWRRLREETSDLEDAIKQILITADEELRKTTTDLYDLSAETLWRSS